MIVKTYITVPGSVVSRKPTLRLAHGIPRAARPPCLACLVYGPRPPT